MSNEVTVKDENSLATTGFMEDILIDSQSGSGFETITKDDIAIPFIGILQAGSPQLKRETKVEGAEAGDFYNNVLNKVFKTTIQLIPCAYQKSFVEWVPRDSGGGLVAQHDTDEILKQTTKDDKNHDILPNGNHIVTTAYHYCLFVKEDGTFERVVLSLVSTQLKRSKRWNSQMMSLMIDINGKKVRPPMFSHIYPATTILETKDSNSWYGWNFGAPKLITDPGLYKVAKQFHEEVIKGLIKAQVSTLDLPVDSGSKVDSTNIL
jgi:hypothetical protein